jgi:hypothetical protein
MKIIEKINKLNRPDSIHSISAYEQDANIFLEIVAYRTYSQGDENQRFGDVSNILADIGKMAGVAGIRQDGTIDHEEGRGWFYQVETIKKSVNK